MINLFRVSRKPSLPELVKKAASAPNANEPNPKIYLLWANLARLSQVTGPLSLRNNQITETLMKRLLPQIEATPYFTIPAGYKPRHPALPPVEPSTADLPWATHTRLSRGRNNNCDWCSESCRR